MRDDNYICIQGWMVNQLGLKGNELLCYALVYGFSQAGENSFDGSLSYISKWLNCSIQTVLNTLQSLVKKGLLEKEKKIVDDIAYCSYKTTKIVNPETKKAGIKKTENNVQKKQTENQDEIKKLETVYFEKYDTLYKNGVLKLEKPILNYAQIRKLESACIKKFGIDTLIKALELATQNQFVVQNGYGLNVILSANVLNGLLNQNDYKRKKGNVGTGFDSVENPDEEVIF